MDYSTHRTLCVRSILIAMVFIIIGILSFYTQIWSQETVTWRNWVRVISGVVLLIFGLVMLVPRYHNIMSTIGLMCLGIGLSRLIVSLSNVFNPTGFSIVTSSYFDVLMIVVGYVTMWFAAYQIYRGANFLQGNAMNAFIMRFTSMAIVLGYVLVILYTTVYFNISFRDLLELRTDFLTSPILYTLYFILLCSREAFEYMEWEKVRKDILDVAAPLNPGLLLISEDTYEMFRESYGDYSKWREIENGSPVERELRFNVMANNRVMDLVLRKWHGSDAVYLSLIPSNGAPFISTIHSTLVSVEFEKPCIRLIGERNPIMALYIEGSSLKEYWRNNEPIVAREV